MTGVLIRGKLDTNTQGEHHVKTQKHIHTEGRLYVKKEIGNEVLFPQTKKHLGPPETEQGEEESSPGGFGGSLALPTP